LLGSVCLCFEAVLAAATDFEDELGQMMCEIERRTSLWVIDMR
jgi:hypothetical protein